MISAESEDYKEAIKPGAMGLESRKILLNHEAKTGKQVPDRKASILQHHMNL